MHKYFSLPTNIEINRWTSSCQRLRSTLVGLMLLTIGNNVLAEEAWPTITLPRDIHAFNIGEQIEVNGLPMRLQGFVSPLKPAQLAEWFRQNMGKPLVENTLSNKLILGRVQGEYYLTVQLETAGKGTRGVAAVTHIKTAYENRAEDQATIERWLSRLPAGSKLLSKMISEDAGKVSTYLLVTNTQNENLNRERINKMMRADGFELEHESISGEKTPASLPAESTHGKTLFFKGKNKEAMATLYRDNKGNSAITLNIITQMERFK